MAELIIEGVARSRKTRISIAGYTLRVDLRTKITFGDESLSVPASGSARLGDDGVFRIVIDGPGEPQGPVGLSVFAPNGIAVHHQQFTIDELGSPLRLRVQTVPLVELKPSDDPALGARLRIVGQVIDQRGRTMLAGLPVVIWGVDRVNEGGDPAQARPLVIAETQNDGRFSADWTDDVLSEAFGRVSGGERITVPLDAANRLPLSILLVINLDETRTQSGTSGCSAPPPRSPDQADLAANPAAFSQDLGGGCVDLTTPNRALEEFSYFIVVRTSEPRVTGVTLNVRRTVPPDLLIDLLGVSIAAQAIGLSRQVQAEPLPATLALDVHAARSLVRNDRPPSVAEIAKASWLSEVSHTKGLIDAGVRKATGRTPLDADHPIDWDDTPTVYLALDIAHGHLLQYREVWRADGYSLGDLLYSLPLAPGQRRQIAVVDWDRRTESAREERLEFEEQLDALLTRDRDILEIVGSQLHEEVSAGSRNTTWGVAGGIGAGFIGSGFGIFGGVSGGASGSENESWQDGARTFSADSMQRLRDRVSQRASSLRGERSSVVQSVDQGETLRAETEVVANYNRCHSLTIEYFEVLRHFLVTHELAHVQECLFVPLPMVAFDRAKALRWREPLSRFLKNRDLLGGFAAIERIADNWVGWDFPVARYSEEAIDSLEGELRISFLLPRPRDDADGKFQVDMWKPFAPFLPVDTLELFTAKLNERTARERDRVFREEIAPGIAEALVQRLRFAFVNAGGGETEVSMDATLVSRYAESYPLYVTLNPAGAVPSVPREDIAHVKIWYDGTALPPDAQVIVHSGRLRYRTPHLTAMLFDERRILDDIREGDPVVVATPVTLRELRNPREENIELADRLVAHLNEFIEFYHQAIWVSLDAQRRYMLLDAVLVPGQEGKSIASVCTNELIGIVGNSLVLPVAPGQRLDPTLEQPGDEEKPVPLANAYAAPPAPPLRVSVPTRGVYAEAVSGECNACEKIDNARYWRWSTEGQLELPQILPVSTESRASEEPDLTPTPLPAPLVQIQNAPAVPNPAGLGTAFDLLARPGLFQDITGLEGTQRNARAAFEASLSAAFALGDEAAKLAGQQELGRNAGRMLDRISQARNDGLLTQDVAQELAASALRGLIGESREPSRNPVTDPVVDKVIDQAAQTSKADIKLSSPSETVEVSFDDDRAVVGGALIASAPFEVSEMVRQPVLIEFKPFNRIPDDLIPFIFDTYDLIVDLRGAATVAGLEAHGLFERDPADSTKFRLQQMLRIVHPADSVDPSRVAGSGKLPVAILVHGQHAAWSSDAAWSSVHITRNLDGYAGLQTELAEHGIISVSVDTNAANFFGSLIEMRAGMVLGALDALRKLNNDSTSRFHGRIDVDRVALMGHSRGGDAVVRAAHINRGRSTATKYGIKAVCALAPTDLTGMLPSGPRTLTPAETPFFAVVYGALDGDVSGRGGAKDFFGTGFRHYDRARCDKAMVFLDHCNHNRFNEVWAADGDESGTHPDDAASGGRLLSVADHTTLTREYIGGLFRWKLLADVAPKGLFDGTKTNTLGAGVSLQWSFGSQIQVLDDMEDPVKPRNVSNAFIDPFPDFSIGTRQLHEETNHSTTVLFVEPPPASPPDEAYRVVMRPAERDWSGFDILTFGVGADFNLDTQATIDAGQLPDFNFTIIDVNGASAVIAASTLSSSSVPRRPVFHLHKSGDNCTVLRLETMSLPLTQLAAVDLTQIESVGITAAAGFTRHLFFDSIQLVRS